MIVAVIALFVFLAVMVGLFVHSERSFYWASAFNGRQQAYYTALSALDVYQEMFRQNPESAKRLATNTLAIPPPVFNPAYNMGTANMAYQYDNETNILTLTAAVGDYKMSRRFNYTELPGTTTEGITEWERLTVGNATLNTGNFKFDINPAVSNLSKFPTDIETIVYDIANGSTELSTMNNMTFTRPPGYDHIKNVILVVGVNAVFNINGMTNNNPAYFNGLEQFHIILMEGAQLNLNFTNNVNNDFFNVVDMYVWQNPINPETSPPPTPPVVIFSNSNNRVKLANLPDYLNDPSKANSFTTDNLYVSHANTMRYPTPGRTMINPFEAIKALVEIIPGTTTPGSVIASPIRPGLDETGILGPNIRG
jgi:hypothetical protein